MRNLISILFVFAFCATSYGQDKPIKFTVAVSTDSILMDNVFEVKFTIENANGQNFEAPEFAENFDVVSGPNFASSVSMVNGETTQSMTISYYLQPKEIGTYYIQPASVQANGKTLETVPLEVFVHPNPDGIKQSPPMGYDSFHMDFGDSFGQGSPFEDLFKDFNGETMPFGFDGFFKLLDPENMPQEFNEMFKQFNPEMPQEELEEILKQFQEQMPEFDFSFPEPPTDKQPEQETGPKKKRKTTRI